MQDMNKVSIENAEIFYFEGNLINVGVEVEGAPVILPLMYVGVRLEGAPEDQVWVFERSFLGNINTENDYNDLTTSRDLCKSFISKIKENGFINLVKCWNPISESEYTSNLNYCLNPEYN